VNVTPPVDNDGVWTHVFTEPAKLHALVTERQGGLCAACWEPLPPTAQELHHRQRRRVLGWCACNVVGLHPRCHTLHPLAVHQRPEWAASVGLIVPTWASPPQVPLHVQWPWSGESYLSCDGLLVSELVRTLAPQRA
jgi:hypothetical protein